MTNLNHRGFCLSEMPNYSDRDAFVSDLSLFSIWGDAETADIPAERVEMLQRLWDAAHRTPREICEALSISQAELSRALAIPYRTVQDWCRGERACPIYVSLMMQSELGLL